VSARVNDGKPLLLSWYACVTNCAQVPDALVHLLRLKRSNVHANLHAWHDGRQLQARGATCSQIPSMTLVAGGRIGADGRLGMPRVVDDVRSECLPGPPHTVSPGGDSGTSVMLCRSW
jgi:hypothetical protein